jgi:hypothetical protein
MGLDISYDTFHGAYSAFNRFRKCIATVTGGSYPPHDDKTLDNNYIYYNDEIEDFKDWGLCALLEHSDCDGEIDYLTCEKIANELESLLPKIEDYQNEHGLGGGHIEREGGFVGVTKQFILGCREAVKDKQPIIFG